MKNSFKNLLVAILVLAAVVLPVFAGAESFKATETDEVTQGVITCANMYDWNFGSYNDIQAFISMDDTQTLSTLTGQADPAVFGWFYNALLEYNAEKGVWVVTNADLEMDGINENCEVTLGEGKMVLMFHDNVTKTQEASFNFYKEVLVDGAELYLGVDPSVLYDVYDYVDGAFLSTVPVEVAEPGVEDTTAEDTETDTTTKDTEADKDADADKEGGINPIVIVAIVVVVIAIVGIIVVVAKRKKAN